MLETQERTWVSHDGQKRSPRLRPFIDRKKLFSGPGQQFGPEGICKGREEIRVSWETDMRGGEGVEVDRGDALEELALVENTENVPADESTEAVTGDRKFCHNLPVFLELLHFLDDLAGSDWIERPSRTRGT